MAAAPGLAITIGGVDVSSAATQVFADASDTLWELVTFHSATRGTTDVDADWATYFSIHCGIRQTTDPTTWQIFLYPIYGSPHDPLKKPYYTRLTINAVFGDDASINADLDVAGSATIIGHGQAIPCTVIVWNSTTETIVSSVEGHTLAFSGTTRIESNPNHTGFSGDGEFVIRYNHAIEGSTPMTVAEARTEFYPAAGWPTNFVASTGLFLRGDVPDLGQRYGFTTAEIGPYIHNDDLGATNYPITHIQSQDKDKDKWDNSWTQHHNQHRADSGTGPLCGDIKSRGSSHLKDFGITWLVKGLAARYLQHQPSPINITTRTNFSYNWDTDSMRAKGRIVWVDTVLRDTLTLMAEVRTSATAEHIVLRDALSARLLDFMQMLKQDFDNNSWLETRNGGSTIAYWQLAHYWQGMLVYQESFLALNGVNDTKVHEMMVQFAQTVHENTLEWTHNAAHPRDANVTYTGGETGWYLENDYVIADPGSSTPTTGTGGVMVALYEWAKVNGIDQGAKQDAIISQLSGIDYKWHYAGGVTTLYNSIAATMGFTVATGTPFINLTSSIAAGLTFGATVTPTIAGGGLIRTGAAVAATGNSTGTAIAVSGVPT